ncbi:2-polyprenyl-6-methoxyphenol hydroxylase-like FAD-dependent oxidoreductase [Nocardia fluminea]|uniref:2-polyprenyl-6-methoxyphenol hydroxylase-like FAD-dependent oxidoreductase n=2 Tax=Nocardia fluminea TaxID=134984 RepID=A0A2N3V5I5_9NOCA|nr:NAD(P)/FAD-dependent oxidoreductase [Nocardia fluminea]PKV76888.1 2-polyprenyl-6-methoxyphenol hydroxylase-like FAD-dependent oxidoreductase [Nocardia fluminea]
MTRRSTKNGRVAVIGGGPAGMATALSVRQTGHEVTVFERYPHARVAGNILNLWPGPIKALGLMGVDTEGLGAGCFTEFRSHRGKRRARIQLPADIVRDYHGGYIGLLRRELYQRMLATLPEGVIQFDRGVTSFEQDRSGVRLHMSDGAIEEADVLIGADGIDSMIRRTLWGDSPKREHNLHVLAGFVLGKKIDGVEYDENILNHSRTVQGTWSGMLHRGEYGYQWWVLEAHDAGVEFTEDIGARARKLADEFGAPLTTLIDATDPSNMQRWPIRDRKPIDTWSSGRVTLAGDAAHPTSPYAAYGAGMATEDGYFLGRALAAVDLTDHDAVTAALARYEEPRKPHTARQSNQAYYIGQLFHHTPRPLRGLRDAILDHTPLLQKVVGESSPGEIIEQIALIDEAEQRFAALRP